jgi:Ala-tRNA(Pro) deacylase
MAIALTLQQYLDKQHVPYEVMTHKRTYCSSATAHASSISSDNLAKGVLVRQKDGFLLAIVPASCHVQLGNIGRWLSTPVALATEEDITEIFDDCELGSVPPVAGAYGLPAVMDDRLEGLSDIYFEGGDHCSLLHVAGGDFERLMDGVPHARIGMHDA